MSEIIVAPLTHVEVLTQRENPSFIISAIGADFMPPTPPGYDPARHIKLAMHDIAEAEFDLKPPKRAQAELIIETALRWDRTAPLLIHCYAGVSRSGAAALMTMAALNPGREHDAAQAIRAASSWAWPNSKLIKDADDVLGCNGRLIEAAANIGPANLAAQGEPYRVKALLP